MGWLSDIAGGISNVLSPVSDALEVLDPIGMGGLEFGLDFASSLDGSNQSGGVSGGVQPFTSSYTGGSSQLENQLLGSASNLDSQMNSLISQANNPNLSEGQVLKLQTQIQKLTRMYEMISEMLKSMNEAQSTAIHNMVQ